jgi:riboflavin kinase/FMN adenylyltransferase
LKKSKQVSVEVIDINETTELQPIVATVGFFDGVHAGHRYLIEQVQTTAREKGLSSAVITFKDHPRKTLQSEFIPELLSLYSEKLKQLETTGVEICISMDFTVEMSKLSAREFIQQILKEKLNVATLLVGYDHRFGHNREEGFYDYKRYGHEVGIEVLQAMEYNPSLHISSSHIRKLLECGEVQNAARLFTYNYSLSGIVIEGFKVGRTIGYPTANIEVVDKEKIIPANGIYAVWVYLENYPQKYKGMLYIGNRPTLYNDGKRTIEVNIFDLSANLYSKKITIEFVTFIRGDHHFASIAELTEQINKDKETVLSIMNAESTK